MFRARSVRQRQSCWMHCHTGSASFAPLARTVQRTLASMRVSRLLFILVQASDRMIPVPGPPWPLSITLLSFWRRQHLPPLAGLAVLRQARGGECTMSICLIVLMTVAFSHCPSSLVDTFNTAHSVYLMGDRDHNDIDWTRWSHWARSKRVRLRLVSYS